MSSADSRCGYISIIGRPNVGKSSLLNKLLDQKISITSRKPQTTRWHTLGIKTEDTIQCIYVDTPGIQSKYKASINKHMNREAIDSLAHVDVVLFLVEALVWTEQEEKILKIIRKISRPISLIINKIDKVKNKEELLPFINKLSAKIDFNDVIPISATKGKNIDAVEKLVCSLMPVAPHEFPEEQITDRNERFFAAEFIREKLIRQLGDELPYRIAITIERFKLEREQLQIDAVIWVEGEGQKKIVIGNKGVVLKKVGEQSRKDMENMFGYRVYLQTWVKIKKNWTEDIKALKQFGYNG